MSYLKIVNGDLLTATETYIAHQCNCTSTNAKTLAEILFNKYPYADTYKNRMYKKSSTYSKPGTIDIMQNIINMYCQYYPTVSKFDNDSKEKRTIWFQECLMHIAQIDNIKTQSIAMPYNIGCGAAGGDWNTYLQIIENFANDNQINITLYKL